MSEAHLHDEHRDGSSQVFRLSLAGDEVRRRVDAELARIARSAALPGFRPGNVPVWMLRKRIGTEVRDGVVDRMAIGVARKLIAERALQPAGRPRIDIEADADDAVTFTLQLDLAPEFTLGEVGGYRLQRLHADPPDAELDQEAEMLLRRQLFDALIERYEFDVPRDMVDNEYARIVHGFEAEVGEAVDQALAEEFRSIAERRTRLAILFTEIGNAHGVRVPREEVEALVEQAAALDPEHHNEVIDYYLDHPTALAELQSPLFEDRVVAFLLERSEVEDVTVSAGELRQRLEAA